VIAYLRNSLRAGFKWPTTALLFNAVCSNFKPIKEALEQHHFIVAVIHKGITILSSQRFELK
jgi:hypothetical protein